MNKIINCALAGVLFLGAANFVTDSLDGAGKNPVQSALVGLNDIGGNKTLTKGVPEKVNGYSANDMFIKGQFTKAVTGK